MNAILEGTKIVEVTGTHAAGQTNVNTAPVDTAGFECVAFATYVGDVAASGKLEMKVQESDNGSTGWKDLEGTKVELGADDDKKGLAVEVVKPLKRHLRAVLTRSGADSVIHNAVALLSLARREPVTQSSATRTATVPGGFAETKIVASPVEGTA